MKSLLTSKTFWVFVILLVGSVLNATGVMNLELNENAEWLVPVISVIGIVLRLITKDPIVWDKK